MEKNLKKLKIIFPLNILVLGRVGLGKSSIINALGKMFKKDYIPVKANSS